MNHLKKSSFLLSIVLLSNAFADTQIAKINPHSLVQEESKELVVKQKESKKDKSKDAIIVYEDEKLKVKLSGKIAHSTDAHLNASLLNSDALGARGDKVDRAFVNKMTFQLTTNMEHACGLEAQATLRTKLSWGTPRISTSSEVIKFGETTLGSHSHNLERNNIYLQEGWVKAKLDTLTGLKLWNQSLTVGLFPFELGYGISLGQYFAVNPSSLGFYTDKSVDQYAPGLQLSGNIFWDALSYDLYVSVNQNEATSLKKTGEQIYENLIIDGKYLPNTQYARGFGDIDYRVAGRLNWDPVKSDDKKVHFEPYAMLAQDPSKKLEFTADTSSTLKTFGLSGDFEYKAFEFGFDAALNRGHQEVFAWDRNRVIVKTGADGIAKQVYSHVYDEEALTNNTVYVGDTSSYRPTSGISSALNSQLIDGTTKYSGSKRFRDAYTNKYRGKMLVADLSLYVYERDLKVSAGAGIATGDTNPNTRTGSGATAVRTYKGFVSQQELFSGKRIKSVFVMGPAGYLVRPNPLEEPKSFATSSDGFTNIIFAGMGATFAPKGWKHKFSINPNVLTYWQDAASKKYDTSLGATTAENAANRLGTELNVCSSWEPNKNLKFSFVSALFLPGKHYTDIKGTPLSAEIADLLKSAESGVVETLPTLGTSAAFTFSFGMEYCF